LALFTRCTEVKGGGVVVVVVAGSRPSRLPHKVCIYKEYNSVHVCPLVGIGTLPTPRSPASVPLSPETEGVHSPAGEGLGESQFRRLEKSLALCLLCGLPSSLTRGGGEWGWGVSI
jgi:hypothetical protein